MSITLAGAAAALLSGKALRWSGFGGQDNGSITLATAGQRRIFEFLLRQSAAQVAAGSEALISGLIAAWKNEGRDPAQDAAVTSTATFTGSWRLYRVQAFGFGGLNQFGGDEFDLGVGGYNWCLEGQNGSGKTALINSVLWALTGQRVREHVGPVIDRGERSPVFDDQGAPIGTWPALAAYPASRGDLAAEPEVWVLLTFVNGDGEVAEAFRRVTSPRHGLPIVNAEIDPRLAGALQFVETSLLMPARLSQMGFGEGSQSLYSAVKRLTGLDQLADIAQGVSNHFAHNGRRFLRYAKDQGIDVQREAFGNSIRDAAANTAQLGLDLAGVASIEAQDLAKNLQALVGICSTEASRQLAILESEIAADVDVALAADREKIKSAVATARVLLEEKTDHVPLFGAWAALTGALRDQRFLSLSATVERAEDALADALRWHRRQLEDRKLRLKAVAAEWFNTGADPACPLCDASLKQPEQIALAREMDELKRDADVAERKIGDVCARLEKELREVLPEGITSRLALLREMEPRGAYIKAVLERFVERKPFTDVLTGFATCVRDAITAQKESMPEFDFAEQAIIADAGEPVDAVELRRFISILRRLTMLANWWREHRGAFAEAFADLRGRAPEEGDVPERSIRGQLKRLEDALSKAQPYDEAAKCLAAAGKAAQAWQRINTEQRTREEIRDAMLPLKDLRLLVDVETARSIHGLSGRIDAILARIHLRERLTYRNATLKKKEVEVQGAFGSGMKIDAALVANTSWLRAILWAFILALREETVQALGANPLPLLLLDDPQVTFDPRNKRKWAQELARLANQPATEPVGAQLIVTTHEHEFFMWLTELEKMAGQYGLIAPVDESFPVATIVKGGCLQRFWSTAEAANDDAAARQYIAHVRIHAEKLLKLMMRADGPDIQQLNLEKLRDELQRLQKRNVPPYNRKAFGELLKCLQSTDRAVALLSEVHHSDAETLGVAQGRDVHDYWQNLLEPKLLRALRAGAAFAAFRGDGRTFAHEPCVLQWPDSRREQLCKATLLQTGIAAAAKTDGHAGDGLLMIEEWEAGRLQKIHLPNHEVFRLAAGTLEPVASIGDLIIVSNYAQVHARGLVVASVEDRFLARRYNEMEAHPEIAVLTGQSIDPYALVEPVIVVRDDLQKRKIVGTLFEPGPAQPSTALGSHEFLAVDDPADYLAMLDSARLFKVQGRSAEPLALDGQYLMTREAVSPEEAMRRLDGKLVVAVDGDGAKYFKRLRRSHGPYVILESLNSDGSANAELMTLDDTINLPRLERVLPVVGVLFELPGQT